MPLLACLYLPFLGGGLLTDDFAHVDRLTGIDSPLRIFDAPDTFGFYRPITQASLALAPGARGARPVPARAINLVLHAAVIALALVVARLVLESALAAGLAALAFALTPKAPPIAVLWISARGELLMALFSLASVAAWIVWTRRGGWHWLTAAAAAYACALLSKETATLLPVLLVCSPRAPNSWRARASAVAALLALGAAIYLWRAHVGALTPFSGDAHYELAASLPRLWRSASNYAGRMLVAPLGLVVAAAVGWIASRTGSVSAASNGTTPASMAAFSMAWIGVFLAPVLPIVLRSELYVYLPVFGLCLSAGWIAERLVRGVGDRRGATAAIGVFALALAGYQAARASGMHDDLLFSQRLAATLRQSRPIAGWSGDAVVLPADAATEGFLRAAVGGYFYLVLQHALPGTPLTATVRYENDPPHEADVRLLCAYRQDAGTVLISPAP